MNNLSHAFEQPGEDSADSNTCPHDVLMSLTVGQMADILRTAKANGSDSPIDWRNASTDLKAGQHGPRRMQSAIDEYYSNPKH